MSPFHWAIGALVAVSAVVNNSSDRCRASSLGAAVPALMTLRQKHHPRRFAASIAMMLLAGALTEGGFGQVVYTARTFFGVNRVRVDAAHGYRSMFHGTTLHGMQSLDASRSGEPLSYFHRTGPIGQVFAERAARVDGAARGSAGTRRRNARQLSRTDAALDVLRDRSRRRAYRAERRLLHLPARLRRGVRGDDRRWPAVARPRRAAHIRCDCA